MSVFSFIYLGHASTPDAKDLIYLLLCQLIALKPPEETNNLVNIARVKVHEDRPYKAVVTI